MPGCGYLNFNENRRCRRCQHDKVVDGSAKEDSPLSWDVRSGSRYDGIRTEHPANVHVSWPYHDVEGEIIE